MNNFTNMNKKGHRSDAMNKALHAKMGYKKGTTKGDILRIKKENLKARLNQK